MAHQNRLAEVKVTPVPVRNSIAESAEDQFTMAMAATESTPVAIRPL